ncbi:hypothetical protein INH39_32835 [Massilia violaceinigra]|uniref:Uncharacterized protein n=1 Tax=Massilia violaceinigra TaxID=2045208 RepID=A0ABY4AFX6_9BURK|nr:hypothetical protein [Massilia violaceinigra]UOD33694.1 hypothetical protein INH39_32835 [Massilia violaceinigra]
MGQIICRCGGRISTTGCPNKHEYVMIADTAHEKFVDQVVATVEGGVDAWLNVSVQLDRAGPPVFECPECKGLLVFWKESHSPTYYIRAPD